MKYNSAFISTLLFVLFLSACTQQELKTPCPDFGVHCKQIPINSWDYPDN